MKLPYHPFGRKYFHIPTGKIIYLSNKIGEGFWSAHHNFRESMEVHEDDLRLPTHEDLNPKNQTAAI